MLTIMFVGSTIPSGTGSVQVFIDNGDRGDIKEGCVSNVRVGQDRNTGMTITPSPSWGTGSSLIIYLFGDNQCQGSPIGGEFLRRLLPPVMTTKNWWVSLS